MLSLSEDGVCVVARERRGMDWLNIEDGKPKQSVYPWRNPSFLYSQLDENWCQGSRRTNVVRRLLPIIILSSLP